MNIFSAMKPNSTAVSAKDIPFRELFNSGKRVALLDFDNTLGPDHATEPTDYSRSIIAELKRIGYRCCLVSNAKSGRSANIAKMLDIPCITYAHKPRPVGVIKAMNLMSASKDECIMVGDQIFTDVIAGRYAGVHTILVDRYNKKEIWYVVLKRPLEKLVRLIGRF